MYTQSLSIPDRDAAPRIAEVVEGFVARVEHAGRRGLAR